MEVAAEAGRWRSGWPAGDAPDLEFLSVAADEGRWSAGQWPSFEYRDLGLAKASGGKISAAHLRAIGGGRSSLDGDDEPWHRHEVDFELFYVLSGSVRIQNPNGEEFTLPTGSACYHPPRLWHRHCEITSDFSCVRIVSPVDAATEPLPANRSPEGFPTGGPRGLYTFDIDAAYQPGVGPCAGYWIRDLLTDDLTDGRIHAQVVRALDGTGGGPGWHYHTSAQWLMVLSGQAELCREDGTCQTLAVGDSVCIGRGPRMKHRASPASEGYAFLELCMPADYQTVGVAAPEIA